MKLKAVINLFAGPGVGKSTIAAGLFYKMKMAGYSVECPYEYAKEMIHEERNNVLLEDQLMVLAKQHRRLFRIRDKFEFVILDSPVLLSTIYLAEDSIYDKDIFAQLTLSIFNRYPNLNYLLARNPEFGYETLGRREDLEAAQEIDKKILSFLDTYKISYKPVMSTYTVVDEIMKDIAEWTGVGPSPVS